MGEVKCHDDPLSPAAGMSYITKTRFITLTYHLSLRYSIKNDCVVDCFPR